MLIFTIGFFTGMIAMCGVVLFLGGLIHDHDDREV